ncbi:MULTISPECIES: disulfide bond formation protein B [Halomonas]|uniref:Disulfide bond formation protein B n=1 Tax=Halomonas halophila TaxID=29573 RepID=A0ABQ0U4Q6_9GAMM|nr:MULTISPECIES: disulfide bond formation protein B [Halomonas]MDR5888894.1 disulfide bond formation protein B [Halomonas salina]RAH38585.1 disulfide bond formation protein B [Halomonas sp. SL1]WJY08071.1 disulfide bond formation protein B [Halomonas halophila]GEK73330.1 disulfide bond formation protein B [Halomonas halophila]
MIDAMREARVRGWSLVGLAFCVMMMAVALGLEHLGGLEPCPLCIFQRVAVIAAGVVFAVAALHDPKGRLGGALYGLLSLGAVGTGIGLAWRHLWLQSLPADEVPSCGPGLDYMMEVLPLQQVVSMVLNASGECAEISARFLGLSLPGWTLIGFAMLAVVPLGLLWRACRSRTGYRWSEDAPQD